MAKCVRATWVGRALASWGVALRLYVRRLCLALLEAERLQQEEEVQPGLKLDLAPS